MNNEKTLARLAAIQTTYSANIDNEQTIDNLFSLTAEEIKSEYGKFKQAFARKLIDLCQENKESLIETVIHHSDNVEKSNNELVQAILIVALTELMMDEKTPRNIIVSQYVNITADFFNDKETGYVNAVLDRYVRAV